MYDNFNAHSLNIMSVNRTYNTQTILDKVGNYFIIFIFYVGVFYNFCLFQHSRNPWDFVKSCLPDARSSHMVCKFLSSNYSVVCFFFHHPHNFSFLPQVVCQLDSSLSDPWVPFSFLSMRSSYKKQSRVRTCPIKSS